MIICDSLVKKRIEIVSIAIDPVTGEVLGETIDYDFIYEPQKCVSKVSVAAETEVTS